MAVGSVKGFKVVSPKGKALWCKFKEPERKFDPKGEVATDLVCDPSDPSVKAFITKLEDLRDKAFEEAKATLKPAQSKTVTVAPVFKEELDEDGEPTGLIKFKFKTRGLDDREGFKVNVVDASTAIIKDAPLVGNGSVIRVSGYANPYHMPSTNVVGVSLGFSGLQIIDLVPYGGSDFDVEEDGYTSTATTEDSEDF